MDGQDAESQGALENKSHTLFPEKQKVLLKAAAHRDLGEGPVVIKVLLP